MVVVLSMKEFKKHAKKYLKKKEYIIVEASSDSDADLSSEFNRVVPLGDLSPGNRLVRGLRDLKKGGKLEISEHKLTTMQDNFLDSSDFAAATMAVVKGLTYSGNDEGDISPDKNIFVVYPNKTYKYLGKAIIKRMRELFDDVGFKFIFSEEELEEDPDILTKKLKSKKHLKPIAKQISKLEKKYKLK